MAALLSTLMAGSVLTAATAHAAPGVDISSHRIPGADGVPLDAKVIEPRGDGPHPVLVMPASWGTPNIEYVGAAAEMAYESGYVVVSYTARGFYASGGEVEVAGPEDVADASKVIDWALANTDADPDAVGMAGISYGAGISAMTAAADRRVRAISAMSGWSDLVASLYPNRTVSTQGAELLLGLGHLTGRFGDDLSELERAYRAGRVEEGLDMAPERAPLNKLDELNSHGTAVMLANAWGDSLFPPQQMASLYKGLAGPKRLMLAPGDHATPELFGAAGLPNHIWDSTKRWFDHHLRGIPNGIDGESPVQVEPVNGGPWRGYADWDAATGEVETRHLGAARQEHPFAPATGALSTEEQPGWSNEIQAGRPTLADSGTVMISGALQGTFNIPTGVSVPLVDRTAAGVWATEPYERSVTVSGAPRLTTTVTPEAETTSLFAYLYDVDRAGAGSLITHKPITLRDASPGRPQQVDLPLEPTSWEVPAGHRLALVVDTVDPRYESADASAVTFGSSERTPSTLEIPLG
ncbi:CocE/NonD family hydrolase [Parasphingorhabdus pacifica]